MKFKVYSCDTREEAEANANLIAAAPELLEAARMVEKLTPTSDAIIFFAVIEKVRAAIAKAEGTGE